MAKRKQKKPTDPISEVSRLMRECGLSLAEAAKKVGVPVKRGTPGAK